MSKRVYNFNPGPATLPLSVLEKASKSVLEYKNLGMSLLEISHRSKDADAMFDKTEKDMLDIMELSTDDYQVLFLQGGASTQFAMIPMNFLTKDTVADYVDTGTWSTAAIKEAKLFGNVNIAATSEDKTFTYIPVKFNWSENPSYVHLTSNNTIRGTQYHEFPHTGNTPVMIDTSSDMLSRKMDFEKFSLIYAGAQKNLGPAGVTLVIIKKSLLEKCNKNIPTMLSYGTHCKTKSCHNTPPVFAIYVAGLVLDWIKENGGLGELEKTNNKKAELIYNALDELSDIFRPVVTDKMSRSKMNIVFKMASEEMEKKFLAKATEKGFVGLKGHRSVGGLRASIYNAFPLEGVEALVDFMEKFTKEV